MHCSAGEEDALCAIPVENHTPLFLCRYWRHRMESLLRTAKALLDLKIFKTNLGGFELGRCCVALLDGAAVKAKLPM